MVFSSLAHGMLTGKYKPGEDAPLGTRAADDRQNTVIKALYWTEENKQKSQELLGIAQEMGVSAAELAIAWCLKNPSVTSVILGATRVEQVEQNLKAVGLDLPEDIIARVEGLFAPPEAVPGV